MCETCGCGEPHHPDNHEHLPDGRIIRIQRDILSENNIIAQRNRGFLEAKHTVCLNVVGSPGSGKTTLLERVCKELGKELSFYVIEGDQQSSLDARRIESTGVPAIQINTGTGCHLDAAMIHKAFQELDIRDQSIIWIENVGNLVCPALFDLGENRRVVIYSVAEGNDKPLKYPYMFHSAHLVVITKTDLLPYVDFTLSQAKEDVRRTRPEAEIVELSVKTGAGMKEFYRWVRDVGRKT